jgi:hypothetical protein
MATTTAALTSDIEKLNAEANKIREKISADTTALAKLQAERVRIADGLAAGTENEGAVAKSRDAIAVVDARLAGNRRLLAPIEAQMRELTGRRVAADTEENARQRRAEVDELKRKGEAAAAGINEKILQLVSVDFARFDEIRYRLASEFVDFGGHDAAISLFALLYDRRPGERPWMNSLVRHEEELKRRGWKSFFRPLRGRQDRQVREPAQPLPAVEITLRSMNPPER